MTGLKELLAKPCSCDKFRAIRPRVSKSLFLVRWYHAESDWVLAGLGHIFLSLKLPGPLYNEDHKVHKQLLATECCHTLLNLSL
jgi:hypothetical protein